MACLLVGPKPPCQPPTKPESSPHCVDHSGSTFLTDAQARLASEDPQYRGAVRQQKKSAAKKERNQRRRSPSLNRSTMLLGSMSRAAFSPAQRGTEPPTSVQDRKRAVTPSGPSMSAQLPTLMPTSTASGLLCSSALCWSG